MSEEQQNKEAIRACLKKLFANHTTKKGAAAAFKLTYPKFEEEKQLPATTELTISQLGKAAFPMSPLTAEEGLRRCHRAIFMNVRAKTFGDLDTQEQEDEHRTILADGKGNMMPSAQASPASLLFYLRQFKGRVTAFSTEYLPLYFTVYPQATEEEKEKIHQELQGGLAMVEEARTLLIELLKENKKAA